MPKIPPGIRERILKAVLEGGSRPSEEILERIIKGIIEEAPIVPRGIRKTGIVATNPMTGNLISDVRLQLGKPRTTEFSTYKITHDPIRGEVFEPGKKTVRYAPQAQVEAWDEVLRNWDVVDTFYRGGTKDPWTGKKIKTSGLVDALEAIARWTGYAAGPEAGLQKHIRGLKAPVIKPGSLNSVLYGLGLLKAFEELEESRRKVVKK